MLRLDVDRSLLEWAVARSGKSATELSKKQDLGKLDGWLSGTIKPTRRQLEEFAKATYTPFGYLLLSEPPQEQTSQILHFRTLGGDEPLRRSIDLEDTIDILEYRQEWMREYLIDIGAEPLGFVGSSSVDDDPVAVSDKIKSALGLVPDWTSDYTKWEDAQQHLLEQVEGARIFVSQNSMVQNNPHRRLDPEEFRGFVLVDDYAPFVFVNRADMAGAQMFTLAHELAHVWMGESASFDLRGLAPDPNVKLERVCNSIAAEFLVPAEGMLRHWDEFKGSSDDPYRAASDHFKVSLIVAARRALDTGCISQREFGKFYADYSRRETQTQQRKQKGGPTPSMMAPYRVGRRFMKTVATAVRENQLLYSDAYYLTGLKSESFDEACAKILGDVN